MGMTENTKLLIKSLSSNDLKTAKRVAIACIAEDKTAKNKSFCEYYQKVLNSSNLATLELPPNIKGILEFEDLSNTFVPERIYISEQEQKIVKLIEKKHFVSEKMKSLKIQYLNSILLYGESGTGKTTFARYIGYKLNLPFLYLNFSNLIDSHLGKTAGNIAKVFDYIRMNNCVLFMDEIDAIGSDRGLDDVKEMSRVVISLMQELDRLSNDIIVIAATNLYDKLDPALIRRFSIKHEIKYLNHKEREELVRKFMRSVDITMPNDIISMLSKKYERQNELVEAIVDWIAEKIISEEIVL